MSYPITILALLSGIAVTCSAADPAIDAKQLTLIIVHKNSDITITLNGMPIRRINAPGPTASDTLGTLPLLAINGENVLDMEAKPSGDAANSETTFQVILNTGSMADFDRPIFEKKFTGAGKAEFKMTLHDTPHWGFLDAEIWKGDTQGLLDAVKTMHKTVAAHDVKAFSAYMRPGYDDMKAAMGAAVPSWEETSGDFADGLKGRLVPLPAKLKVSSAYGDRLFVVTTEDGDAPIQIFGETPAGYQGRAVAWELGRFWIHSKSGWTLIRE